jgi:hypothetical protein
MPPRTAPRTPTAESPGFFRLLRDERKASSIALSDGDRTISTLVGVVTLFHHRFVQFPLYRLGLPPQTAPHGLPIAQCGKQPTSLPAQPTAASVDTDGNAKGRERDTAEV